MLGNLIHYSLIGIVTGIFFGIIIGSVIYLFKNYILSQEDVSYKITLWGIVVPSVALSVTKQINDHIFLLGAIGAGILIVAIMAFLYGLGKIFPKRQRYSNKNLNDGIEINEADDNHNNQNEQIILDPSEEFYETAWSEIENDKINRSLWSKSFAKCEGDENKTKATYIQLRVKELLDYKKMKLKENQENIIKQQQNEVEQKSKNFNSFLVDTYEVSKEKLNEPDENGYTALMKATLANNFEHVQLMLKNGANPNIEYCGSSLVALAKNKGIDATIIKEITKNSIT